MKIKALAFAVLMTSGVSAQAAELPSLPIDGLGAVTGVVSTVVSTVTGLASSLPLAIPALPMAPALPVSLDTVTGLLGGVAAPSLPAL
jgi:hypothetical protein